MPSKCSWSTRGAAAFLMFAVCGCSNGLVPVEGIITLDGAAVEKGTFVLFAPIGNTRSAVAKTDEKGQFRLTTFEPGDGIMPGEYKIVLVNSIDNIPLPGTAPTELIQENRPEVKAYLHSVEYSRDHPKPRSIPQKYSSPATTPLSWKVPGDGRQAILSIDSHNLPQGK